MRSAAKNALTQMYEEGAWLLKEIRKKERSGFVFVGAEEDLTDFGRRTGFSDVAGQCALGNAEAVLAGEVEVTLAKICKKVNLVLYFVERYTYLAACMERRRRRLER